MVMRIMAKTQSQPFYGIFRLILPLVLLPVEGLLLALLFPGIPSKAISFLSPPSSLCLSISISLSKTVLLFLPFPKSLAESSSLNNSSISSPVVSFSFNGSRAYLLT